MPNFSETAGRPQSSFQDAFRAGENHGSLFMQPIPPANTKVGLVASEATKFAWANPNDNPVESYLKK